MSKLTGKLTISTKGGKSLDSQDVGDQDPFMTLKLGNEKFRTKTHKKGGNNPVWDQSFIFNLKDTPSNALLNIEVFDEDVMSNDKIGRSDIPLHYLFTENFNKPQGQWFQLVSHSNFKKITGYVHLAMSWEGSGHDGLVGQAPAAQEEQAPPPTAAELELQKQRDEIVAQQAKFAAEQYAAQQAFYAQQQAFQQQMDDQKKQEEFQKQQQAYQQKMSDLAAEQVKLDAQRAEQEAKINESQPAPFAGAAEVKALPAPAKKKARWVRLGVKGVSIDVDAAGGIIYCNAEGDVFERKAGTPGFVKLPGNLCFVSRGSDGDTWGLNKSDEIFHLEKNGTWKKVKGAGCFLAVGAANQVLIINSKEQIFKRLGDSWAELGGKGVSASISEDGDIWLCNKEGAIYYRKPANDGWQKVEGKAKNIAVAAYDAVYVVNQDDKIFKSSNRGATWEKVEGGLKYIEASSTFLVGTNKDNDMFIQNRAGAWLPVTGAAAVSVSVDSNANMTVVDKDGKVFDRVIGEPSWAARVGSVGDITQVSKGADGDLWAINKASEIFHWEGKDWVKVAGEATCISCGSASQIAIVDKKQKIYRRNAGAWKEVDGLAVNVSIADDGDFWVINKDGNIYVRNPNDKGWNKITNLSGNSVLTLGKGAVYVLNGKKEVFASENDGMTWNKQPHAFSAIGGSAGCMVGVGASNLLAVRM